VQIFRIPIITLVILNVFRYAIRVIRSFRDARTRELWQRGRSRWLPPGIWRTALRKLVLLDSARELVDLTRLPGNRLEKLSGDRAGQHSIRINVQFRVCFRWSDGEAYDVEITDYH
jgi:proteic killer suppression protein